MGSCFTSCMVSQEDDITQSRTVDIIHKGQHRMIYKCLSGNTELSCKTIQTNRTWQKEAEALQRIKDLSLAGPELINIHETEKIVYIYYKYIPGIDLFAYREANATTEIQASIVAKQLVKNIAELHNNCIWHLDIKLENIICRNGNVSDLVLIDFGHALISHDSTKMFCNSKGTPGYAAPELFQNYCSGASDVWSLGVVIYTFLFGKYPVIMKNNQISVPKSSDNIFLNCSSNAKEFILACLKISPMERSSLQDLSGMEWICN